MDYCSGKTMARTVEEEKSMLRCQKQVRGSGGSSAACGAIGYDGIALMVMESIARGTDRCGDETSNTDVGS